MFDDSALVSYRAISLVSCRAEAILIMSFRRGIPPSLISSGQYLSAAEKRIKQVLVNLHKSGIKGGRKGGRSLWPEKPEHFSFLWSQPARGALTVKTTDTKRLRT